MTPLIQVLSIGTMATWLTMSGATSVACLVKVADHLPALKSEVMFMPDDGEVVDLQEMAAAGSAPTSEVTDQPTEQSEPVEPLPEPPPVEEVAELPDVPEIEPLPEVPDLPEPKPDDLQTERPKEKPVVAAKPRTSDKPQQPRSNRSRPPSSAATSGAGSGTGNGIAGGGGSGNKGAGRFAGGRMPDPTYPSSCISANQEGRVVVLFSVDDQGNVVNVSVTDPSPFPAMNSAAVSAVRRYKFPPGPPGSMKRSITFRLK